MEPLEIVPGQEGGPYAVRTRFGWVLGGAPKNSRIIQFNHAKLTSKSDEFGNREGTRKRYSVEGYEWRLKIQFSCSMNNRPLISVSADRREKSSLDPDHLLHLKYVSLPTSRTVHDLHGRRYWRQASYLAEQFWRRWWREYLSTLQTRAGPVAPSRKNVKIEDVVLEVDGSVPRGVWPLGRVEEVRTGDDSKVRTVKVRCRGSTLWRPVSKLVKIDEISE